MINPELTFAAGVITGLLLAYLWKRLDLGLGWYTLYIDENGMPSAEPTNWQASCFVLFTHVIVIGKIEEIE